MIKTTSKLLSLQVGLYPTVLQKDIIWFVLFEPILTLGSLIKESSLIDLIPLPARGACMQVLSSLSWFLGTSGRELNILLQGLHLSNPQGQKLQFFRSADTWLLNFPSTKLTSPLCKTSLSKLKLYVGVSGFTTTAQTCKRELGLQGSHLSWCKRTNEMR